MPPLLLSLSHALPEMPDQSAELLSQDKLQSSMPPLLPLPSQLPTSLPLLSQDKLQSSMPLPLLLLSHALPEMPDQSAELLSPDKLQLWMLLQLLTPDKLQLSTLPQLLTLDKLQLPTQPQLLMLDKLQLPTLLLQYSLWFQTVKTNSTSSISTMPRCSTRETGTLTRPPDHTIMTAQLPSPTTGRVLNNALSHGSAEVLECAREEDGAQASMVAKDHHSQLKLQASAQLTEQKSALATNI